MRARQCSICPPPCLGTLAEYDDGLDVLGPALVGTPMTAASLTAGCASMQFSTSAGKMFSAADLSIRVVVPRKLIVPSARGGPGRWCATSRTEALGVDLRPVPVAEVDEFATDADLAGLADSHSGRSGRGCARAGRAGTAGVADARAAEATRSPRSPVSSVWP